MRHFPGPGSGGNMLFGFMGFIGTIVLLGLIALFVVMLVKRAKGKSGNPMGFGHAHHGYRPPMPPALQLLDERLARGEIEVEDYMTRKAALLGSNGPIANEWTPQQPPAEAPPAEEAKTDPSS